jgi:hypothetical protein
MDTICACCEKPLTSQERATYRNRCEDCWCNVNRDSIGIAWDYAAYGKDGYRVARACPARLDGRVVFEDSHS